MNDETEWLKDLLEQLQAGNVEAVEAAIIAAIRLKERQSDRS